MSLSNNAQTIVSNLVTTIQGLITNHSNITGNSNTKGHVQAGGNPQDINTTGSSASGTDNGYYARADHVHKISTASTNTKGIVQAGSNPQDINTSNSSSAGTDNGYYARADHIHKIATASTSSKGIVQLDSTPTANSNNAVSSAGIKAALNTIDAKISDLYETKITCSNYNPNIIESTATATVTVTVKLVDFNGNPVTGTHVSVNVVKGHFNNGTKTYAASTNNSGEISTTYKPTEWGLATFTSNNSNIQVNVKGWKTQSLHSTMTLKYNQDTVTLKIANSNVSYGTSLQAWTGITVPNGLRPTMPVSMVNPSQNTLAVVKEDGSINRRSMTGSAINNSSCYVLLSWHY